ncbi:hypothetical protein C8T65DRAFT_563054, partial [Cerioporus squamosus]
MVDMCLKYKKVVEKFTAHKPNGLREFEFSSEEWAILKDLRQVLKDATMFFSEGTPNLAKVIPAMDHIDKFLTTANITHHKYHDTIRIACGLAKKVLDKYYSYTDMSATYRATMVLHPHFKLHYFKKMRWPERWIQTARDLVTEIYEEKY